MRLKNILAIACVASSLLFFAGCYETQFPLGSPDKAIVDPSYVGDFVLADKDQKSETIIIRNIDNRLYYVEWLSGDDKPLRMVGYTTDIKGVTFANLRGLTEDGSIDDKFILMRVSLSDDHAKLSLRSLKDDFFKDKKIDSSEVQQKLITDNLENEQMYDGGTMVATRVPPAPNALK